MRQFYDLYPADLRRGGSILIAERGNEDFILKYFDERDGKVKVRSMYSDMTCPRCKKLDIQRALARGIDPAVVLTNRRRDLYGSFENLYIMSDRSVQALQSVTDAVIYYAVPSTPGYWISSPKLVIAPDPLSGAFDFGYRCPECGLYNSVVWGLEPMSPPNDVVIGAYALAGSQGMRLAWFGSQEVYDAIRRAKLTGWVNLPWRRPLKGPKRRIQD